MLTTQANDRIVVPAFDMYIPFFEKENQMKRLTTVVLVVLASGCAATPKSFVRSAPGWKTVELHDALKNNYDDAWQKSVDTVAKSWDIEILDKGSGYLRTAWQYGISGGNYQCYRGRLTVKFPEIKNPDKVEVRTQAQWLQNRQSLVWVEGFDTVFERDVYTALAGRVGRTVPTD